jgi:GntR family transcriptional repressor for pyruvate dehydrogenase complex
MLNQSFLEPIDNKSVVATIVERITNAIIDKQLLPGQKIPTEMMLSESFNVGRNSIREAVKILTALGILEIRRADGTYVSDRFSDNMINPLVYSLILEEDSSRAIYEVRYLFEVGAVEQAIQKAEDNDVKKLKKMLVQMEKEATKPNPDRYKFTEMDMRFHKSITEITQNSLIVTIGNIIGRLTRSSQLKTVKAMIESSNMEFIIEVHEEIVRLIEEKDYDNVRSVIEKSHSLWKKNIE